jgi:hypothetical protein
MKKLFGRDKTSLKRTSFDEDSPLTTRPYPLSGSRSSSFTSLPLGGSPSIVSTFSPKKTPSGTAGAIAAVGILRALDPHLDTEQHLRDLPEDESSHYEPSIREDKKEKKPFWDRTSNKGKERERDHGKEGKERERRDEDNQPELPRMIGTLIVTSSSYLTTLVLFYIIKVTSRQQLRRIGIWS